MIESLAWKHATAFSLNWSWMCESKNVGRRCILGLREVFHANMFVPHVMVSISNDQIRYDVSQVDRRRQ